MSEQELKACPFCGGKAELRGWDGERKTAPEVWVACNRCGASTDARARPDGASLVWNTRASPWRTDWENAPKDGSDLLLHWDWDYQPFTVVGFYGDAMDIDEPEKRWRLKYDHQNLEPGWGDPTHFMLLEGRPHYPANRSRHK